MTRTSLSPWCACLLSLFVAATAHAQVEPAKQPTTLTPYLRFDRVNGMAKGAVKAIVEDSDGFIWFGTDEGLSRYDGYQYINYVPGANTDNTLASFTVTALAATKGALWIGTVKGLDRLDLATKKFTHYKSNPKDPATIASDYITALEIGKGETVWIGTNDAGVDALTVSSGAIKHYRSDRVGADAITDDAITAVHQTVDDKVWIGTREAGLKVLVPETGKITRYGNDKTATSLSSDEITSIYQDQEGVVWVGTLNGLDSFDAGTRTFKRRFVDVDSSKAISSIVGGADGALWLGLRGTGVLRFDRHSGAVEHYNHDGNDPNSIVNALTWVAYSDRGGVLWFGGDAGGASKLSLTRRQFTYYRTNPGLAFYESGDLLWLGTLGAGLRSFNIKTGEVQHYLDQQLGATYTIKILPGDNGSLWIGTTDAGLFHFTPSTGQLEVFDKQNGALKSDAVVTLLQDHDSLWIGTFGGGLVRFDPARRTAEYFTNSAAADSLSSDAVDALYQDKTRPEILWVGTSEGLNAFDKRTGKVVRYVHDATKPGSLSHDHVTDIYQDHAGQTWIATWGGGLDRLDPKTGVFVAFHTSNGLASDVIYGIMEDKTGSLWLTTNSGLTRFNPAHETATTFRATDGLQDDEFGQGAFYTGANDRFYVGGPNGFNVFSPENIKIDSYAPPVVMTDFEVLGEPRTIPDKVSLSYRDRWFSVSFAALSYAAPELNRYRYRLAGFHDWIETDRRFVSYSSLPPGNYKLEIVGSNAHGVWAAKGIELPIHVPPPPWRTWWAFTLYGLIVLLVVGLLYRRHRAQLDALTRTHRLSEFERELALTSAVQEGFFPPKRSIRDHNLQVEAFFRAAAQCGGDWWTCEPRPGRSFVIVGDATGHGVGSAMVTAAAAASFRSLGTRFSMDERLTSMNEEVLRVSRGQYHMTLTAVDIDLETGEYTVYSLGGVPVFALAPNNRVRVLMCPGTPLGSEQFEIGKLHDHLQPGERLLILTDGISEVPLVNKQLLGPRGVGNFFTQTREQELETALQALISKVEEVNASAQDDDWTVVMLQWSEPQVQIEDKSTVIGSGTQTRALS